MSGVIVIDKPTEFTSFDVVAVVRNTLGTKKVGHCGTLDPNATGVLPLLIGNATKAQDLIVDHDKGYIADFKLGLTTDTLDIWGKVTNEKPSNAKKEEVLKELNNFKGEISQIPPMYSAIRKDGRRLYTLAREGIEIKRDPRNITVYEIELLNFNEKTQEGTLKIFCSKGTYVRSIIDDLGKNLKTGGVMTALKRVYACGYKLEDSISLEKVKSLCEKGEINSKIQPTESLFKDYSKINVSLAQSNRFANGGKLNVDRLKELKTFIEEKIYRVYSNEDVFIGLGQIKTNEDNVCQLKVYKLFLT